MLLKDKNLHIIFGVTLISLMGVSSLTPALPEIATSFGITPKEVSLLITFFTLPGVILTPILGVLADRFGRKKIIIPSLFLFAIAGTLCFFVKDFNLLVGLRFFQGIGAASLASLNVTILGDLYSGNDRGKAMGYNSAVISISTASYPIIGGILASIAWNYPFLLPSLSFLVGYLVLTKLNNPEPKEFLSYKKYFKNTIKLLSNRNIIALLLLSVLTFIILYGPYLTYLPFIIRDIFKEPPYIIGIIMSFSSLASFVTSGKVGDLMKKHSIKKLIIISTLFYFTSMIIIPFATIVWLLIIPSLFFGIAQGINIPCIQTTLTELAPMEQRAAIMSLNGMIFRLGQTLGPIIIIPIYINFGLQGTYEIGSLLAILMFITATILLKIK